MSRTIGTIDSAFAKQRMLEGVGSRSLDRPSALLDEVGVELRTTLDSRFPSRSEGLRMAASTVRDSDGNEQHVLSVRMGDGTGIDVTMDQQFGMRLKATQALPGLRPGSADRTAVLPEVELRYDRGSHPDLALLQRNLGSVADPRWGPAQVTASLPGSSTATNNVADSAASTLQSSPPTPVGRLLERDASNGIRAQRDDRDITLRSNYAQDGRILYDGTHVVMQSTRGVSEPVIYDKADLLSHAARPEHLARMLEQGGVQRIVVSDGRSDSVPAQSQTAHQLQPDRQRESMQR